MGVASRDSTGFDEMTTRLIHGILQAIILEWVAISFSRNLPNPGIEPGSPALYADSLPSKTLGKP